MIEVYDPLTITPLVRTPQYDRALACAYATVSAHERGGVLTSDDPAVLAWVVEEHVLRRSVGGPEVMAGQYAHLRAMAARPNITIRVIPGTHGAHPGLGGGFEIVLSGGDVVVCEQTRHLTRYHDRREIAADYTGVFARLCELALSPERSAVMLSTL